MTTDNHQKEYVAVSPLVKYSVFMGIFLTRVLDCVPWVWGNLSVYVISYYHNRGDSFASDLSNWTVMVNVTGFNLGMLIGGPMGRKIGLITTMFFSIIFYNAGLFLTFASLNYSAILMCITFGGMTGLCGGVIESTQLSLAVRWTEKYYGVSTSCVPSSNIALAILVNFAITWFINPSNLQPNSSLDKMAIFTQKSLIDNVPPAILYYSFFSTILNITGFLLLRNEPGCKNIFTEISIKLKRKFFTGKESILKTDVRTRRNSSESKQTDNAETCELHEEQVNTGGIVYYDRMESNSRIKDVTPLEALKRKEFYALSISIVIQTYAFFLKNSYYKTFGLLYIPDDHFLAFIGIINCIVTPICAWLSGFCVDRFGVKPTMLFLSSIFAVMASVFFVAVQNKWVYLFCCMFYGGSLFTLFCLTAASCVKVFGKTYFASILGMTLSPTFLMTFTLPPFAGWVIATYGWFVLFISAAFLALGNMLVLIWGLPENCQ